MNYFMEQHLQLQLYWAIVFLGRKLITRPSSVSFFLRCKDTKVCIYFVFGHSNALLCKTNCYLLFKVKFIFWLASFYQPSKAQKQNFCAHYVVQWFPIFFIWRHTIKLFKFLRHTHYIGSNKKFFT